MGDNAVSGTDFAATNGTLTFAPGDATESFTIPITDNGDDNAERTFTLRLSMPSCSLNLQSPPTTRLISKFTDGDGTEQTITTKVRLDR